MLLPGLRGDTAACVAALERSQAPAATLNRLAGLLVPFLLAGNAIPLLLVLIAALFWSPGLLGLAALLVLAAGWHLKFVSVVKVAHVQGYGIGKLQRGRPVLRPPCDAPAIPGGRNLGYSPIIATSPSTI